MAYVQERASGASASAATLTPTLASGAAAGHSLVAVLWKSTDNVVSVGAGWTIVGRGPTPGSAERAIIALKDATTTGGETSGPAFTWSGNAACEAWIGELDAAYTYDDDNAASNTGNVTNLGAGHVADSAISANGIAIWACRFGNGNASSGNYGASGFTEQEFTNTQQTGAVATRFSVTSGTTVTVTRSWGSVTSWRATLVRLVEAAGGSFLDAACTIAASAGATAGATNLMGAGVTIAMTLGDTAGATADLAGSATVAATGHLTADPTTDMAAACTIAASTSVTADATATLSAGVTIAATAGFDATAARVFATALSIAATVAVQAGPLALLGAVLRIDAAAALAATAAVVGEEMPYAPQRAGTTTRRRGQAYTAARAGTATQRRGAS